mgnify:FL=1
MLPGNFPQRKGNRMPGGAVEDSGCSFDPMRRQFRKNDHAFISRADPWHVNEEAGGRRWWQWRCW